MFDLNFVLCNCLIDVNKIYKKWLQLKTCLCHLLSATSNLSPNFLSQPMVPFNKISNICRCKVKICFLNFGSSSSKRHTINMSQILSLIALCQCDVICGLPRSHQFKIHSQLCPQIWICLSRK